MVHRINSWDRRITCVVHPDAGGVVESERFGNIRTEQGPAGYVLQDGTRVAVTGTPNELEALKQQHSDASRLETLAGVHNSFWQRPTNY